MSRHSHISEWKYYIALSLTFAFSSNIQAQTNVTKIKGPGGTVDYFFENGAKCHKRLDYVKSSPLKTELSASFLKIGVNFGLDYQTSWKNIRRLSPKHEDIYAVIFDICYQYGINEISREEYLQKRGHYQRLRDNIIFGEHDSKKPPTVKRPTTVLLMDSPVDKVVYNQSLLQTGATNADEISELLDDLPIVIPVEKTSLIWSREAQVHKMDPELIVIHFSAFESDTVNCWVGAKTGECNKRLRYFLRTLVGLKSKILLYSRTEGFSSDEFEKRFFEWLEIDGADFIDFRNRFTLFGMTDHGREAQFGNPDTAKEFKATVTKLLGIGFN